MADLSDRQAAASRQGAAFEETVVTLLRVEGWTVHERKWRQPDVEVEIDIVAEDPQGERWWIECKGSWESPTGNGLERTDTAKKAIGSAAILRLLPLEQRSPYMLITSHLPKLGSSGDQWMRRAVGTYFDRVRVVALTDAAYSEVVQ